MRVLSSAFRLTPTGDAVRGFGTALAAVAVYILIFFLIRVDDETQLLTLLAAIDAYYVLYLITTWIAMSRSTAADARTWAIAQETGSRKDRWIQLWTGRRVFSGGAGLFTITMFSLFGLFFALLLLPGGASLDNALLRTLLGVVGVVAAWLLLHTSFALFYAHLYYQRDTAGGLSFPGGEDPDPLDFAYFAFTVGISFAASDVSLTDRKMRRITLFHGILAFFYNTAILALVINIVLTQAA